MPVLKNPRHEKYAQLLAQLHGEMTVADAHEQAGYKRNEGNASTLAGHPDIRERVKELKGRAARRTEITVATLMDEFEEARELAIENKQASAAVHASKEKAVLSGLRIERAEIGAPGEFDHMSDDELLAGLRERLAQLGLDLLDSEARLAISNGSTALNEREH